MFDRGYLPLVSELMSSPFASGSSYLKDGIFPGVSLPLATAALSLSQPQDKPAVASVHPLDALFPLDDERFLQVFRASRPTLKSLSSDLRLTHREVVSLSILLHLLGSTSTSEPHPIQLAPVETRERLKEITSHLSAISFREITWPNEVEARESEGYFKEKVGLPGVIGLLSHTRVYHDEGDFIFQGVVTPDLRFRDVYISRSPSTPIEVFEASSLYRQIHQKNIPHGRHLIGGPQLPTLSWLLTPFIDDGSLPPEETKFNSLMSQAMLVALQAVTSLFKRFPGLRRSPLPPSLIPDLLTSAIFLHNRLLLTDPTTPLTPV